MTTTNTQILTKEEIATKYLQTNLQQINNHIENTKITESKKQEMAVIIDTIEQLFRNYIRTIEDIKDDDKFKDRYSLEKTYKLETIKLLTLF